MENIVIELSRYNSIDSNGSSEWTNHLSKNIKIEQGDQILVKQCFIDTRLIDNTSILIEEDIEWTLIFAYYMTCHGINQFTIPEGSSEPIAVLPDGNPYILTTMYNPLAGTPTLPNITPLSQFPLTDKKTVYIPKGTYERSYLAEYITKQFQSIQISNYHTLDFFKFSESFVFPKFKENPQNGEPCIGFYDASYNVVSDKKKQISSFQKPLATAYIGNSEGLQIPFPAFFLFYDGEGVLRPGNLSSFLVGQDVNYEYNPPENNYGQVSPIYIFSQGYNDAGKLGKIEIAGEEYETYDGGYIGASEVALVYNDQNSGKYSFQYLHTPIVNGGNECVGNYVYKPEDGTFQNKILSTFNNYSGIIFVDTYTNLTQRDNDGNFISDAFLSQLGFSYNDIVCKGARNLYTYKTPLIPIPGEVIVSIGSLNVDDFYSHITKNFYPINALSNTSTTTTIGNYKISSNSCIFGYSGYNFMDSDITDEIFASSVPVSSLTNAGHYLVDILGYDTNYINDNSTYNIKASVSNFYLSGDSFTSTLGPDPYVYIHEGVSTSMSQLKVRILNPVTKEGADNVGPNSTIYLQIIKAPKNNFDEEKK